MLRLSDQVKDPERWLRRRLNSRELRGVRVGREWQMTDSHVQFLLRKYSTDAEVPEPEESKPPSPEVISISDGLSARSARRLRRVP
jgi:hypothetical protein